MNRDALEPLIRQWLDRMPQARAAADLLLEKAAANGRLPAEASLPASDPRSAALEALFSARYTSRRDNGLRLLFLLRRFEEEKQWPEGTVLEALAAALGVTVGNRAAERSRKASTLRGLLNIHTASEGFPGAVAMRESEHAATFKGRFWNALSDATADRAVAELNRYFLLLRRLEELIAAPAGRFIRAVHLSREVARDTHWFRPGTQPWHWAADDLLAHLPGRFPVDELPRDPAERSAAVLASCGIVENLTSVRVLLFGDSTLEGSGDPWRWPREAAAEGMPVWLSAAHLEARRVVPAPDVTRVVCVENETSFWDLLEENRSDPSLLLVYTEGHANRAVVALLRQLAAANPRLAFHHQGDLDLPGVRILHSLRQRTGLDILPERMDAATLEANLHDAIALTPAETAALEKALREPSLPCADLLGALLRYGKRLEQEVLTAR